MVLPLGDASKIIKIDKSILRDYSPLFFSWDREKVETDARMCCLPQLATPENQSPGSLHFVLPVYSACCSS
jgi:hypothetical protein